MARVGVREDPPEVVRRISVVGKETEDPPVDFVRKISVVISVVRKETEDPPVEIIRKINVIRKETEDLPVEVLRRISVF